MNDLHFLGIAITVKSRFTDNLLAYKVIDMAEEGDVIVIGAMADINTAIF